MEKLSVKIANCSVNQNHLAVFWLGQAGFVVKDCKGTVIAIDPYLSNCCDRYFGFNRLMPYLINASDIIFDAVVATHAHYDHFDVDSIPAMLSLEQTMLLAAEDCLPECERLGINTKNVKFLKSGDSGNCKSFKVTAVPCDHGAQTPQAIGLLIENDNKKIYITGDTCYREDYFKNDIFKNLDLLILPINGAFGNLDEFESSKAANLLKPRLVVPCHFWNFAQHGGNPGLFIENMKAVAPNVLFEIMQIGGMLKI